MRLAIVTTHPIQYYAPVFRLLHQRRIIQIKVFYTWGEGAIQKHDPGFGKNIEWDIPLLDEYPYEWVKNTATDPGSHHNKGIINPDLISRIEEYKPDALLVFGWAYHAHAKVMRYYKSKLFVCFRGDSTLLDEKSSYRAAIRKLFLTRMYKNVDHAFYVGSNNKAYFKKYGLKSEQLSLAPHAIDNDRFAADRSVEAARLRNILGIDKDSVLVLFAGKLEEKKSPLLLLDAFKKAGINHSHLLFVGNGALANKLKSEADQAANIHFMDFQNQTSMPVVYQACDLFCLPSKGPGETWGLAVNEAMACGKAILVSDKVGCAVDLVSNNGVIFKSEQTDELIAVLKSLCADKTILTKMGKRSAEIIRNFSFVAIAKAIESKLTEHYNQRFILPVTRS
ncbi:glycosyltransferase family 4 protein [Mucilaginibacter rigui]|uniref:Glycosyltransferase family 4 protein n=2 Tax=Mucilaginibacter rigui TaxID=534635 RepID=A0ABR7X874_9SPHI|nr:glycosyltransferase family 4 protein [Mucilaginibacter rigui]